MMSLSVLLVPLLLGVDFGWEPIADNEGGIQYIIRLDDEQLDSLRQGNDILSDLPANMEMVRSYRITTEKGALPNQGKPPRRKISAAVIPTAVPGSATIGREPSSPSEGRYAPLPNMPINPQLNAPSNSNLGNSGQGYNSQGYNNQNGNTSQHNTPSNNSMPRLEQGFRTNSDGSQTTFTNRPQDNFNSPGASISQSNNNSRDRTQSSLVAALVALGLSLGANCYLGMVSVSLYNRCRVLLSQLKFATLRT